MGKNRDNVKVMKLARSSFTVIVITPTPLDHYLGNPSQIIKNKECYDIKQNWKSYRLLPKALPQCLSRLVLKPSHFRLLPLLSSKSPPYPSFPQPSPVPLLRFLSTSNNNNNGKDQSLSDPWKFSQDSGGKFGSLFSDESPGKKSGEEDWLVGGEDKAWSFGEEEKDDDGVLDLKEEGLWVLGETRDEYESRIAVSGDGVEESKKLQEEEKHLTVVLKGPNRAFGGLILASGITDAMLDSLIALKDLEGVDGLPPLSVIEDMRYQKNTNKSSRAEVERQKLEEMAKRQVDDKGRAYGTGRRKCSIARVWVQPNDGKFIVNDKELDVYFPILDHRAALLRPFSETKTLGLWDINCTVKGGGFSDN
ncbi:hypothetical protein PTKIN_Ptkin13bG0228700 [Pterospermum kingtungense]